LYDDNGYEIKTSRGSHKRIKLFDLIEISKTDTIRITASFSDLTIESFFTPEVVFNDDGGFELDTFNWELVSIPNSYLSNYWETWSLMWSLLNPKITYTKKAKRRLKHFKPYRCVSVWKPEFRTHVWNAIYLKLVQKADNLFDLEIQVDRDNSNSEIIIELVNDNIYPLDQIPLKHIKELPQIAFGEKYIHQKFRYLLVKHWKFFYFPKLKPIADFFELIQKVQKKFSKNYLRRIKRNIAPLFEEINRLFYSIALNKFTATVLFVDTLIKPILFRYIDLERDFHDYIYPFFQTISAKFKELRAGRKEFNKKLIKTLFEPLKKIINSLARRDYAIFEQLKITCSYPKCSRPIHYSYIMRDMEIRRTVLNYWYNKQFDSETPQLSFVCCNCVHILETDLKKRQNMLTNLFNVFSNFTWWLNGLETIYLENSIHEIEV
jgi:hypothetical protein